MSYCDIRNDWSFNEYGDLDLTVNYEQSLNERFNCPRGYLSRYYNDYGSDILDCLGSKYREEEVRLKVNNTLKQDINIKEYTVDELVFNKGSVSVYCTINGLSMNFTIGEEVIN